MKRNLWAMFFAIVLSLCLLPTQTAQADSAPKLMLRYASFDTESMEVVEEPTLYDRLDFCFGNSSTTGWLVAYLVDGENETAISPDDLIILGGFTLHRTAGNCFYLYTNSFVPFEGNIIYPLDGKSYELPITAFPEFDFYTSETPSVATYIDFNPKITSIPYTLYYCAFGGATLNSVTLEGDWKDYAVAQRVSDTCWSITITHPFSTLYGNGWIDLLYSGTRSDGEAFTDYSDTIYIYDATVGLKCRTMHWNGEEYVVDGDDDLQSAWNTSIDDYNYLQFYFFDGENEYPLSLDELTTSGDISLTMEEYYNVPLLTATGFGESAIHYTRGGVTYSLPVYISLPSVWFYSSETASKETYVTELRVTEPGHAFYFVTDGSVTIPTLTLSGDCARIAYAEQLSDTCWKITFTGLPGDIGYYQLNCSVRFALLYEYGDLHDGYARYIPVVDATPGLRFRQMRWNANTQEYYEDLTRPLRKEWNVQINAWSGVKFYFFDGKDEIPVTLEELTVPNCIEINLANSGIYYNMNSVAFGEGTIDYVHNGKTYSLPVSVTLPDCGFYSSENANEQTYLSEFRLTEDNNTLYFVAINDYTLTSVTVMEAYADIAQAEKISDTCWKITVTEISRYDNYLQLSYSGTDMGGYEFTDWWDSIEIIDATPGLRFRYMRWNSDTREFYEDLNSPLQSTWSQWIGYSNPVKFYFFDGKNEIPVTLEELIVPDFVEIESTNNDAFYNIGGNNFGDGVISYVRDGVTYTLPVSVILPDYGFYSSEVPSKATYLTEFSPSKDNMSFYFVSLNEGAFTFFELTNGLEDIATFEQISDTCIKITITGNYQSDRWYGVSYRFEGPNVTSNGNTSLRFVDTNPGLRFRYMRWNSDTREYYEDPTRPLQNEWIEWIGYYNSVKFYFFDGKNETPVTLKELIVPDFIEIESMNNGAYYQIGGNTFGDGVISYVRDGVTYTLPVSVILPDYGFYSSEVPSKATYLTEFSPSKDNMSFYFVSLNEGAFTFFELTNGLEDIATFEQISDTCIKITITGNYQSDRWYGVSYRFEGPNVTSNGNTSLRFVDTNPGLRFRYMTWNPDKQEYYEDLNSPLQSTWNASIDSGSCVKFYFFDGKNEFPVSLSELTWSDCVEINAVENVQYYHLISVAFGEGTINYVRDGVTYSTHVSVSLPFIGFYSSEVPSEENYITEFAPTKDNNSFYLVTIGRTLNHVEITNVYANLAEVEQISDTCWKITINMLSNVDWLGVYFEDEYGYGNRSIRIIDNMPGLRYRQMRWDENTREYYEDLTRPLLNEWNVPINAWSGVKFYFFDGKNEIPVTLAELTVPNCIEIKSAYNGTYYSMNSVAFGKGTIDYVRDGVTYSIPVSVVLPDIGFYSSMTVSEQTYLSEFHLNEDIKSFYLVAQTSYIAEITSLTPNSDYENLVQMEKISDTCWKIIVNGISPNNQHLELSCAGTNIWGESFTDWWCGIKLIDATPGLRYRYMSGSIDEMYEDPAAPLRNSLDRMITYSTFIKFYFFDGKNEIPVSLDKLTIPGCIDVRANEGKDYYTVCGVRFGRGAIRYEHDGVIYELPVTVDLPYGGFYTSTNPAWNTYLDGTFSVTEESNTLYYIALFGCTMTDLELPEEMAAFTTVTRISDTCWKFTFSDGFEAQKIYRFTFTWTYSWGDTYQESDFIILHKPAPLASGDCGAGEDSTVTWSLTDDGILTISGEGAMANYSAGASTLSFAHGQGAAILSQNAENTAPWMEYSHLIRKVIIEDGVTSIGDNAFADCTSLTDITISETVTSIGENVSAGCESLTTITYNGSEEQWNEIEIAEGNQILEETEVFTETVLKGDVNGDGVVNGRDTIIIATAIANKTTQDLTPEQFKAADVNGDGVVNGRDTITIATAIANKTTDEL